MARCGKDGVSRHNIATLWGVGCVLRNGVAAGIKSPFAGILGAPFEVTFKFL